MDPIRDIPNITTSGLGIPNITVRQHSINIGGIWVRKPFVRDIGIDYIADRSWMATPPSMNVPDIPVTQQVGVPIVNMPGCVKVHKENARNPTNKNKMLVNDDPKQNVVLCDAGMPYYEPPDYRADELTWQTVYVPQEEITEGVDAGEPLAPPSSEVEPPQTPGEDKEEVECPPINARRIGERSQKGDEQVKEYKLTPDGLVCELIWEPVPTIEQFVPTASQASTTLAVAVIATAGATATPLLLRIIKPIIKKASDTFKKKFGKKITKPTRQDIQTDEYRKKKGLPPIKR